MKKIVFKILIVFLIPFVGHTQSNNKEFYAGFTSGFVMPRNLHENWHNDPLSQSADLTHEMNNGFLLAGKFGYMPKVLKKIFIIEIEYSYEKANVNRITTPGFKAFDATVPAFSSEAKDSYEKFNSFSLNMFIRYPDGNAHPYIGLGPGITCAVISFNEQNLVGKYGFEESGKDTGFSYQILFGSDFDIHSNFTLGGGYKYLTTAPTMIWANGTHSHYDPSTHNFFIDIKFHF